MSTDADLRALVETECEGVLQSVLAARQDLREYLDGDAGREAVVAAEETMRGCVILLQTVLSASRDFRGGTELAGRARGIVELLAGPFCLLRADGHAFYVNGPAADLLGRDRHDINRVPFGERSWADRDEIRGHIDATVRLGRSADVVDIRITGADGPPVRMVLRSERLEEQVGDQPLLLMTFDPVDA